MADSPKKCEPIACLPLQHNFTVLHRISASGHILHTPERFNNHTLLFTITSNLIFFFHLYSSSLAYYGPLFTHPSTLKRCSPSSYHFSKVLQSTSHFIQESQTPFIPSFVPCPLQVSTQLNLDFPLINVSLRYRLKCAEGGWSNLV